MLSNIFSECANEHTCGYMIILFLDEYSGSLLLASSMTENQDLIWATSCNSFPFQTQLMETQVGHCLARLNN